MVVLGCAGSTTPPFFVIASGTSDAHVRGIADSVMEAMQKAGHRPHRRGPDDRPVVRDFADFIVTCFTGGAGFCQLDASGATLLW
jgi:ribosomal silencing factor RsfS